MRRRTFLGAVGIATISGCLTQSGPSAVQPNGDRNTSSTPSTTGGETPDGTTSEGERVPSGETRRSTIGSGSLTRDGSRGPHGVGLQNTSSEKRRGQLVIRRPDDSVAFDGTYELEPEAAVMVSLTDPLRYSAVARVPSTGASESIDIELDRFDCNPSSTTFAIRSDGKVSADTVSTMMACTNLDTADVPSDEGAEVTLGDGTLTDDGERKPHGVTLRNPTDRTRTARLVISGERDSPLLDGLYSLDPSASVAVTLTEPGRYRGTVSIPGSGSSESFEVPPERFDCNHSSTNVTVQADGGLQVRSISTQMACGEGGSDENDTQGR